MFTIKYNWTLKLLSQKQGIIIIRVETNDVETLRLI